MRERAIAPVFGVVLLVVLCASLAGAVALYLFAMPTDDAPPRASIAATVDGDSHEFQFVHEGGDVLAVEELTVTVTVDGEPLTHQPRVPFVGSTGFAGSPQGPFNDAGSTRWAPGERASFQLACTNGPKPDPGTSVEITISVDGTPIATLDVVPD